jgi:hypothetical protein
MNLPGAKGFGQARAVKRTLSIKAALEWAFGSERVSVEFDEINDAPPATDTIYRLMRQGVLGCKIDGGGKSFGHHDAEIIASFVARLPLEHGGKGMAVQIANLARAGVAPDWMPGAAPRCVPREWRLTKHGDFARTEVVGKGEIEFRGRKVKYDLMACPVTYSPSAAQIAAARRDYLLWWGALLDLRHELHHFGGLTSIALTQDMPPLSPWRTGD